MTAIIGAIGALFGGLSGLPIIGGVVAFLQRWIGWLPIVGLIIAAAWFHGFYKGEGGAEARCEAAAWKSRHDAVEADRRLLLDRLKRQEGVNAELAADLSASEAATALLREELKKRSPQSTEPGATRDPHAIVNDRCDYTVYGAQRVR